MLKNQYKALFSALWKQKSWCFLALLWVAEASVLLWLRTEPNITPYQSYVQETLPRYESTFRHESLFWFILLENTLSALQMVASGIVPLGLSTVFASFLTLRGLVESAKALTIQFGGWKLFLSILPHGIFELPALFFSVLLAVLLTRAVTVIPFRILTKKPVLNPLKEELLTVLRGVVLVLIPLLFISAVVENFITPLWMQMIL